MSNDQEVNGHHKRLKSGGFPISKRSKKVAFQDGNRAHPGFLHIFSSLYERIQGMEIPDSICHNVCKIKGVAS